MKNNFVHRHHEKYRIQAGLARGLSELCWTEGHASLTHILQGPWGRATPRNRLLAPQIANTHIFSPPTGLLPGNHTDPNKKTGQKKTKRQDSESPVHGALKFRARSSLGGHMVQIQSSPEAPRCVYAGESGGRGPGKRVGPEWLFCARHCAAASRFPVSFLSVRSGLLSFLFHKSVRLSNSQRPLGSSSTCVQSWVCRPPSCCSATSCPLQEHEHAGRPGAPGACHPCAGNKLVTVQGMCDVCIRRHLNPLFLFLHFFLF